MLKKLGATLVPLMLLWGILTFITYFAREGAMPFVKVAFFVILVLGGILGALFAVFLLMVSIMWAVGVWAGED